MFSHPSQRDDLQSNNPFIQQHLIAHLLNISGRTLGGLAAFLSFVALCGYAFSMPALYRPLAHGAATHPLTAVVVMCLGIAVGVQQSPTFRKPTQALALVALLLCVIRLADGFLHTHWLNSLTPFTDQVDRDINQGMSNSMGMNSASMLAVIALALILYARQCPLASQIVAFCALGIPSVSLTGYAYQIENFHGQMSLFTTLYGICLSFSVMSLTTRLGVIKALLSPFIGGKIARMQALLGFCVPFFLGFMFVQVFAIKDAEYFGIFVILICWFALTLVGVSAVYHEYVDNQRRLSERALIKAATHDSLTDLPNRRKFFEAAEQEIQRTLHAKHQAWLIMLDIDHFKTINDTAGHAMGDKILIEIAQVIQQSTRKSDIKCRLGGEEFAILLVNTDFQSAQSAAENLRARIASAQVDGYTNIYGPVTASLGLSQIETNDTLSDALSRADELLYHAKREGRNRVIYTL